MSKLQSTMTHLFSEVPRTETPRSSFNRTCGTKTTFDAGKLIPMFLDEVLPGDTMNLKMSAFARLATPLHPTMDNMYMDTHFFFVPERLLWDNWEKFNGAQDNPSDSIDYLMPEVTVPGSGYSEGSIFDYMGLPTKVGGIELPRASFFRAYNLIWNEWFRDQNLQDSVTVNTGDSADNNSIYDILPRGKRHDYFTSCLPFAQKGDEVGISLSGNANITSDVTTGVDLTHWNTNFNQWRTLKVDTTALEVYSTTGAEANKLYADLSGLSAITINQLREAFQTQKVYERDARGGTRYIELIKSHFGVNSSDARLQRPEYLGGSSSPIYVNPVAQTSSTDATTPQGNLAAVGTASLSGHGFTKSFEEHGVIIGLVSVRADLTYQQGMHRMFSKKERFDFYLPAFAHIGEQPVLNKEIYAQGTSADDDVFGYQEAWADYRYKPAMITGQFRSNATTSLDTWHLAQDFASLPALGSTFIEENPPLDRVIAVPSEPHFLFDSVFEYKCARVMPVYSVPGMIDHF